jgi:hypothetical protein
MKVKKEVWDSNLMSSLIENMLAQNMVEINDSTNTPLILVWTEFHMMILQALSFSSLIQ